MEKPFFEFDLTKESDLIEELETLYNFCIDPNKYTKLIFRGPVDVFDGFNGSLKIFNSYDELIKEYELISKWINDNPSQYIGQFSLFGETISWEKFPKIYKYILLKVLEVYGDDIILNKIDDTTFKVKAISIDDGLLTMYKKNGVLSKHKDGKSKLVETHKKFKPANILLYLNKNYETDFGGCFVVDKKVVSPDFGKLVFLNFRNDSDPEHEVSLLNKDVNRIALLFNVMYSISYKEILKIQ